MRLGSSKLSNFQNPVQQRNRRRRELEESDETENQARRGAWAAYMRDYRNRRAVQQTSSTNANASRLGRSEECTEESIAMEYKFIFLLIKLLDMFSRH